MAAPSIAAASANATADQTAGVVVSVPSGSIDGSDLWAFICTEADHLSGATPTITAPGGWTLVPGATAAVQAVSGTRWGSRTSVYRRKASSEPASYTWTMSPATAQHGMVGKMLRLIGADVANPVVGTNTGTSTGNPVLSAITAVQPETLLLAVIGSADSAPNSFTPPGGMNEECDFGSNLAGGDASLMVASQTVGVGTTGTRTFTQSGFEASASWDGLMIAIMPWTRPMIIVAPSQAVHRASRW